MKIEELKKLLATHDKTKVQIYCDYITRLKEEKDRNGKLRNSWSLDLKASTAANLFEKVSLDGLFIDGDSITLGYISKKAVVQYNYQAYKNKLLKVYPSTKFDLQVVCKGDQFELTKKNGEISYSHTISNPFDIDKDIIGAYCIIKNDRGQFVETINKQEIEKIKATAKTTYIWDKWYSEMVIKSVLKRACKRHFKDITVNMDSMDNESSEVSEDLIDPEAKKMIQDAKNIIDLMKVHERYHKKYADNMLFQQIFHEKKAEITESDSYKKPVGENGLSRAIKAIKDGRLKKDKFLNGHILTEDQQKIFDNGIAK